MPKLKTLLRSGLMLLWLLSQLALPPPASSLEDLPNILEEEVTLYLGESKIFNVKTPRNVSIGNPEVADITSVTEDTIILTPKTQGATTFAYTDALGEHSFRLRVLSEDLSEYSGQVNAILKEINQPGVYARLIDTRDKILLKGEVKTQNDKEMIFTALGSLKDKVTDLVKVREEEATVDIDVEVLEVDRGATKTLGFSMPTSVTVQEPSGRYSTQLKNALSPIFHVFDWKRTSLFSATIDALINEGKARVLSRPRLACQSGKEADLLVGGEKPILTTQVSGLGGASGTAVSFKEYGIRLKIKPTVTDNNRIKVGLKVEVSDFGLVETLGSVDAPTAKAYPISKRSAATELFLDNEQTLGIGGLVRRKEDITGSRVAFLGDIPILGMLFRHRTTETGSGPAGKGEMELIILLTPKIIRSPENLTPGPTKTKTAALSVPPANAASNVAPSPAANASTQPQESSGSYADMVQGYILNNFKYPSFIKESGLEGRVKLTLHLSSSGELLDVRIKESSGYKILDDYALSIVRDIPSFPAFPSSINAKDLFIDIPIVYSLD